MPCLFAAEDLKYLLVHTAGVGGGSNIPCTCFEACPIDGNAHFYAKGKNNNVIMNEKLPA